MKLGWKIFPPVDYPEARWDRPHVEKCYVEHKSSTEWNANVNTDC